MTKKCLLKGENGSIFAAKTLQKVAFFFYLKGKSRQK